METITYLHNQHVLVWLNETRDGDFSRFESIYHNDEQSMEVRATPYGLGFYSTTLKDLDSHRALPAIFVERRRMLAGRAVQQLDLDFTGVMGIPPKVKYGRPVS